MIIDPDYKADRQRLESHLDMRTISQANAKFYRMKGVNDFAYFILNRCGPVELVAEMLEAFKEADYPEMPIDWSPNNED